MRVCTTFIIIIILIYMVFLYSKKPLHPSTEGFNLDNIKNEIRIDYQTDNPQIQYTVNPVPYLIDFLRGRAYYPATLPRRPDSIVNPMREPILRVAMVSNQGNMPNYYTPHYIGPNPVGDNVYGGQNQYRAYRYPHNDLLYKPWQVETSMPYNDYQPSK